MMNDGERQIASDLRGIRADHVARYRFAVEWLKTEFSSRLRKDGKFRKGSVRVIDAGCGCGYGSRILAEAGCDVLALDKCADTIAYAEEHWAHPRVEYRQADLQSWNFPPTYGVALAFEVLEHLADPGAALDALKNAAPLLIASVPNEDVFPYGGGIRHHERHYTGAEFEGLLNEAGLEVRSWYGQVDRNSDVEPLVCGRTLVAVADASRVIKGGTAVEIPPAPYRPKSIAIVAQGHSKMAYLTAANQMGGYTKTEWDEVWAINSGGGVIKHDRLFHMDDVLVQEERTRLNGEVGGILKWLKDHPGPVYTSTTAEDVREALGVYREQLSGMEPETGGNGQLTEWERVTNAVEMLEANLPRYEAYPGLVSYPLGDVLVSTGAIYLNNTVALALAFAMHIGVEKVVIFGADYTYPDAHISEKGRACLENLIGMCSRSGIQVMVPPESTLMDASAPDEERFYGYDAWVMSVDREEGGPLHLTKKPKAIPTAEEMEERYRKVPKRIEEQMRSEA